MKRNNSTLALLIISIVSGCAYQPNFKEERVTDHTKRYFVNGFSFLPPYGNGFVAIIHNDKRGVDFEYYHDDQGYHGKIWVGVIKSYTGYTPQNMANELQNDYDHRVERYLRHLDGYDKNVDDVRDAYIARINSVPKPSTQIVKIAGLTCAKSIDYKRELTPVAEYRTPTDGGVTRWTAYFCPVPSQPELPPISIGFSLTVAPGKPMLDMEAILKPLLVSIEITHNPRPAAAGKQSKL